ncbi:MAG: hypothetical protein V4591_03175 [Bdellovibrionota bacterium]
MKAKILFCASTLFLFSVIGCSSSHYIKTEVISNSDRTLKTPDWVLSSKILNDENGQVVYNYKMNLDGSARPDACVAMARSQAVAEMLKYIKNAVTTSGQVEDLNASSDPSYSSLTAFLSQGNISGAQVTESYWEQTMEADASGMRPIKKLSCAVKVGIDKQTLDKQMRDAINGAPGGNPEIRKKLIDAQKNFIDNVGNQAAPAAAAPAS